MANKHRHRAAAAAAAAADVALWLKSWTNNGADPKFQPKISVIIEEWMYTAQVPINNALGNLCEYRHKW